MKGFYKQFSLQGPVVGILWIDEVGGSCKTNIYMALKSRRYIFDLDHLKLSLGIFFILSYLTESLLHQFSGSTFIFVKNTNRKVTNLALRLILAAGMGSIESFVV